MDESLTALSTGAATTPLQVNISIPAVYDVNISGMKERIGVGQNGKSVSSTYWKITEILKTHFLHLQRCQVIAKKMAGRTVTCLQVPSIHSNRYVRVTVTSPSANATVNSCTLGVTVKSENCDTYTQEITVEIANHKSGDNF